MLLTQQSQSFALQVTHPAAGNLCGGGFMMIDLAMGKRPRSTTEMAPAAATRNIYLDKNGNVLKGEGGPLAAIAPPVCQELFAGWNWR
jgi:gamma-glutamyltranspeptidase